MPSIINLKFKGNKSFVAFSNLGDAESLTKTWKVCSKVATYLEQGQRLENLSWRLWHLQNLMVDSDDDKSKREFRKLSKSMGDKLDKEKGRAIEDLEAPDFKHSHSSELIRQRAVEKERSREASQNAKPGTIKRMQFTFSVDQRAPNSNTAIKKPNLKPAVELKESNKRGRIGTRSASRYMGEADEMVVADDELDIDRPPSLTQRGRKPSTASTDAQPSSLSFPSYFPNGFGLSAVYPSPSRPAYGECVGNNSTNDVFSISRPTIELPLEDIYSTADSTDNSDSWSSGSFGSSRQTGLLQGQDIVMRSLPERRTSTTNLDDSSSESSDDDDLMSNYTSPMTPPLSQAAKEFLHQTISPKSTFSSALRINTRSSTPIMRPQLTVRTQATPTTRSSGPGATATSVNPAVLRSNISNNSAPGGVKAECSNCGATHTPLWRRGLNDELNCNACGLYCKLHKRPRPKSMRNSHGEGRAQTTPRQEAVDVMAQCYNCHTTATPLWRKDDEGKTVCNACGLYYKLHGSPRPISMKSDVIRKRSRHDARRIGNAAPETPSASPGASRRSSPVPETSPTLAPDSTTQITYEYHDSEYVSSQSELTGALGHDGEHNLYSLHNAFANFTPSFPGPYHPDFLTQQFTLHEALPFPNLDTVDNDVGTVQRTNKRRRMSVDSASEPPSSAASFSSYNDGYSSQSSATTHSQRSSMDFPFSYYLSPTILRGPANTFWHPPMLPQEKFQSYVHPPMLPTSEESPMDYLHPPMLPQDEESLFSTYLHPPMVPPDDNHNSQNNLHPPMLFPNDPFYSSYSGYYDMMQTY